MKEKSLKYDYKKNITKVTAKTAEKYMNILKKQQRILLHRHFTNSDYHVSPRTAGLYNYTKISEC